MSNLNLLLSLEHQKYKWFKTFSRNNERIPFCILSKSRAVSLYENSKLIQILYFDYILLNFANENLWRRMDITWSTKYKMHCFKIVSPPPLMKDQNPNIYVSFLHLKFFIFISARNRFTLVVEYDKYNLDTL